MYALGMVAMWVGGFVCGLVVAIVLAHVGRTPDSECDEPDPHERVAWPAERRR